MLTERSVEAGEHRSGPATRDWGGAGEDSRLRRPRAAGRLGRRLEKLGDVVVELLQRRIDPRGAEEEMATVELESAGGGGDGGFGDV